jgi:hypothetical protein
MSGTLEIRIGDGIHQQTSRLLSRHEQPNRDRGAIPDRNRDIFASSHRWPRVTLKRFALGRRPSLYGIKLP